MPGTLASTDAGASPAGATPSWARIAAPLSWLVAASWSGRPGAAEAPGAVTASREAETATAAPSRRRHLRGAVIFGCSFRLPSRVRGVQAAPHDSVTASTTTSLLHVKQFRSLGKLVKL